MEKLLKDYADRVGGTDRTLALVALRWIAVEPAAITDPLLADLIQRAKTPRKTSILQYFSASTTSATTTIPTIVSDLPNPELELRNRNRIYCDGACSANGRRGARAGFGGILYRGSEEADHVSRPLDPAESQTNQRAELRALEWAFAKAMSLPEGAEIHTDSEYAIKCFTEWGALWASKGWKKSTGGDVLHQDILKPMWEVWKRRGSKIRLHHVAAHTGGRDIHSLGNAKADALAVASLAT